MIIKCSARNQTGRMQRYEEHRSMWVIPSEFLLFVAFGELFSRMMKLMENEREAVCRRRRGLQMLLWSFPRGQSPHGWIDAINLGEDPVGRRNRHGWKNADVGTPFSVSFFCCIDRTWKWCPSHFDVFQSSVIRVLFDVRFICCVGCVSCCVTVVFFLVGCSFISHFTFGFCEMGLKKK